MFSFFFSFVWFCPNGHAKIFSAVLIFYNAKYSSTIKISGLKNRILLREMADFLSKSHFLLSVVHSVGRLKLYRHHSWISSMQIFIVSFILTVTHRPLFGKKKILKNFCLIVHCLLVSGKFWQVWLTYK